MGGHIDHPQPGFNHWVSLRDRVPILPNNDGLNVNGKRVAQKGYITDELTDYALEWLAVGRATSHSCFTSHTKRSMPSLFRRNDIVAAIRTEKFAPPKTMDPENVEGAPMWVQNQRNSWHGVEFPYHSNLDIGEYYKRYAETMLAVDEGLGQVIDLLKAKGLARLHVDYFHGRQRLRFRRAWSDR